ncbi:hypothetical protein L3Q82_021556, partial [Scortum barcoo]
RAGVFFSSMVLQAVTALVQASPISWVMFCIFNCLRGLGYSSNYIASLILGSEILSQSARVNYTLLGHSVFFMSVMSCCRSLPILHMRLEDAAGCYCHPLFPVNSSVVVSPRQMSPIDQWSVPCHMVIPESPCWLLQKGQVEEAELVIHSAARRNRVPTPEVIFRASLYYYYLFYSSCCGNQNKGEEEQMYTYVDLIRTPNMRNTTVLCVFIWTSTATVFCGLSLNTSNLNGNVYLTCFISVVIDIVVYVATWLPISRAPRPTLIFSTLMFCGICATDHPADMHVMVQVLALVGKMGVSCTYFLVYVFFTELIPAVVRNMGLGIASTAGRIGTIICPYVIYMSLFA